MRSILLSVGFVYVLLVANFYNESHGFNDKDIPLYAFWKVTPIAFLAAFALWDGSGLSERDKLYSGLGLIFGGIGDYVIGSTNEGLVAGAIAFGAGHVFYLLLMAGYATQVQRQLLSAMLVVGSIVFKKCFFPLISTYPISVSILCAYSFLLSSCFLVSASQHLNGTAKQDPQGVRIRAAGFLSFLISDTALIFSHIGVQLPMCNVFVLGTYYIAQYLILCGNVIAKTGPQRLLTPAQSRQSLVPQPIC